MLNKVILIGICGKDPEIRHSADGKIIAKLSIATHFGYGEKKQTTWHRLVFFEKLAENVQKYVRKGSKISVVGRIKNGEYESKEGKKYYTDIIVQEMVFIDAKSGNDKSNNANSDWHDSNVKNQDDADDDLPF